jgi:hypothetical protein
VNEIGRREAIGGMVALMVGGQPVVVGRIVHCRALRVLGGSECAPCIVVTGGVSEDGALVSLKRLDEPDERFVAAHGDGLGEWHWPDANRRQCQGRA